MKRLGFILMFGLLSIQVVANDDTEFEAVVLATPALIEQVKQGGYVIYMRHGKTDTKIPDQVPIDLNDCATQRPLTQAGLEQVCQIGVWFKQLDIPYSQVLASPLCRAKRTAQAAFGDPVKVEVHLQYTAALTTQQKQPIIQKTFELLSTPVETGTNRVLVAHGPNMVEMMKYFPPEGSMVFFRPLGDKGFEYMATITPDHWPVLIKQIGQ